MADLIRHLNNQWEMLTYSR